MISLNMWRAYIFQSSCRFYCDAPKFPGAKTTWTNTLKISNAKPEDNLPVYRVLDKQGVVIDASHEPKV